MIDIKQQLAQALLEIERLKMENTTLRMKLDIFTQVDSPLKTKENTTEQKICEVNTRMATNSQDDEITIHQYSTPLEKITLFRSLFRGREDVFPTRWQNKSGKSGYSPACGNEWTAVCKKPQVKCSECMYQQYLPVTDEVINKHLDAKFNQTLGVYPMLQDETCWFVAIDLDKHDWKTDAKAVMETCEEMGVPAALERSRSGQGGHIWIFFEEPIAAAIARKLGFSIISKTMQSRYQIGLDSYDRLFPNQDTLPKGGFGNLIALPLQGVPRKQGNSVFVDNELIPFDDQWRFLSQIRKLSSDRIEKIVRDAALKGEEINAGFINVDEEDERPWDSVHKNSESILQGVLPSSIDIVMSNMVYISKDGLPSNMINRLIGLAAFQNPDFYKTQAMRLPTYGKPRVIGCAEDFPKHIALPRGCLQPVLDLFNRHDVKPELHDERNHGQPIEVEFVGTLSMLQDGAARGVMAHEIGILSATTAFGKTVVAANIIATRKVNTLVLVHRRELMDQWKERLKSFLEVQESDIGVVGGGKDKRTGKIDIAVIQSLNLKGQVKEYVCDYGQIIVDECHHVSAFSFEQVLKMAKAKYVVGLTATLARQDGQHPIVLMQCGPIRIRIDAKSQAAARGMEYKVLPAILHLSCRNL